VKFTNEEVRVNLSCAKLKLTNQLHAKIMQTQTLNYEVYLFIKFKTLKMNNLAKPQVVHSSNKKNHFHIEN